MAEQNRDLLHSVDHCARLQLLLNEAVEGLSVVVITYYTVALLAYMLKALKPLHLDSDRIGRGGPLGTIVRMPLTAIGFGISPRT